MKKAIVTTTINPPTEALQKFIQIAHKDDWHVFIVGDKKTPHAPYDDLMQQSERVTYIAPAEQQAMAPKLSELIGWNCIQRRNFGLLAAYKWGAEIIATVDDDNIPYDDWGKNLVVGQNTVVPVYDTPGYVYNPLGRFDFGYQTVNMCQDPEKNYVRSLWHRGVPVQGIGEYPDPKEPTHSASRFVRVQADMWDGDPDVDAITRIALHPDVKFTHTEHYAGGRMGPFNSQNTFLHRSVFPAYFLFPHIGRMDDIWAAYVMQAVFPGSVVYGPASVRQDRNPHDLSKDLQAEMIGYRFSKSFVEWLAGDVDPMNANAYPEYFPNAALDAFEEWQRLISGFETAE